MRDMLATDGETTQRQRQVNIRRGATNQPALTSVAFVRANALLLSLCYNVAAETVCQSEEGYVYRWLSG
jgi:hypothetical protein